MQKSSPVLFGKAPAKINLFFEVLGKRQDGYHDVCSVCVPVNLFDTLLFLPNCLGAIRFSLKNDLLGRHQPDIISEVGDVPGDRSNLVVKALESVRKFCHVSEGVDVVLIKRIPSCAGLRGGSSDAATAMMMANRFWNLKLSHSDFVELGAKLGSDVPLFFTPGYSLGIRRGEVVRPVESDLGLDLVIVKPQTSIKTGDAFARLDQIGEDCRMKPALLLRAIKNRNPIEVGRNVFNRLESVAVSIRPEIRKIQAFLTAQDCLGVLMSGSGTACYGICRNRNHARHVAACMTSRAPWKVFLTHTIFGGNRCFRSQKNEPAIIHD